MSGGFLFSLALPAFLAGQPPPWYSGGSPASRAGRDKENRKPLDNHLLGIQVKGQEFATQRALSALFELTNGMNPHNQASRFCSRAFALL